MAVVSTGQITIADLNDATMYKIVASALSISKASPDRTTDGAHTPNTLTFTPQKIFGNQTPQLATDAFYTQWDSNGTEPGTATAVTAAVAVNIANNQDISSVSFRLYNTANKTTLLDEVTIPVQFKGDKGDNSVVYRLTPSASTIKKSLTGTYTPSTVNYQLTTIAGTSPATAYNGKLVVTTSTDGTNYTGAYWSSSAESSYTYTVPANIQAIRTRAYYADANIGGNRTGVLEVYRWSATAPTTFPSGTSTLTWSTGQFTAPATLNGWSLTPPAPVANQQLWILRQVYIDIGSSATSSVTWSSTTPVSVFTAPASPTNRAAVLELFRWSVATPTTFPSGTSTYTWADGTFTLPATTNNWSLLPGAGLPGETLWLCRVVHTETGSNATSNITWNANTATSLQVLANSYFDETTAAVVLDGLNGAGTSVVTRAGSSTAEPTAAEVLAVLGRTVATGDVITVTATGNATSQVWRYNGTAWQTQGAYITGSLVVDGAITASKLLITGSGAALNDDPGFFDTSAWTNYYGNFPTFATITDGIVGNRVARSSAGIVSWVNVAPSRRIPVDRNKSYRLSAWARTVSGSGSAIYIGLALFDADGNDIQQAGSGTQWSYAAAAGITPPLAWTKYTAVYGPGATAFPANARTMSPLFILSYGGGNSVHEIQDLRIEEMAGADLIVDGSITANKIQAGTITVDRLGSSNTTASANGGTFALGANTQAFGATATVAITQTNTGTGWGISSLLYNTASTTAGIVCGTVSTSGGIGLIAVNATDANYNSLRSQALLAHADYSVFARRLRSIGDAGNNALTSLCEGKLATATETGIFTWLGTSGTAAITQTVLASNSYAIDVVVGDSRLLAANINRLGIGTLPSTSWISSYNVIDLGTQAAVYANGALISQSSNVFVNSAGQSRYKTTTSAGKYEINGLTHDWYSAPIGTAGQTTTVTSGKNYTITQAGGTNYTSFGAANNNVGTTFTATSSGTGNGGGVTENVVFTNTMELTGDGELRVVGNIIAYYSDDKLKTNLGNISDALNKVCSLNGFYYRPNETAIKLGYLQGQDVGVSAQQVQKVLPELVVPAPIDPSQYLTVRYERLVPLLIEAIKELNQKVELLEAKLNANT